MISLDLGTCLERAGVPGGSVVKNPFARARVAGSIPRLGRAPGEGNDNPVFLAWRATVHGVTKEWDTT